ncbi:MAG: CRISPR-associated helicase Cas3' [Spirochaetaceae bacterium]|nr:CRISPR-associated helicase Cas3' [Spirochaetaceae bacterium]
MEYIAHVKQDEHGNWEVPHDLLEHLKQVASQAAEYADAFDNSDWARIAGLWHDLGKYKPSFQNYIRTVSGYMLEANKEGGAGRVDHSIVGAIYAKQRYGLGGENFAKVLGYLIAGHHAGLPDYDHTGGVGGALSMRWRENPHLEEALESNIPDEILLMDLPESMPCKLEPNPEAATLLEENLHLWIRMLFSCLVDADFLDTEEYMSPQMTGQRGVASVPMKDLKQKLDIYLKELAGSSHSGEINRIRAAILHQCRIQAQKPPGLFSLTVPTGGGKTLSGMAFALEHALQHGKNRIIVAIPFTSIIEQTAELYRKVFGVDAIIEHHSNMNPDTETNASKLASENWDAPIIVTTNVQLFESLFAARSSACRKLHNIVNSVILLDEAQMLPPQYLQPIISSMRGLVKMFGCTIVLSTATQPVLTGSINLGLEALKGFNPADVVEIIDDPESLTKQLKRVVIKNISEEKSRLSWHEIADAMLDHEQVLTITNSRRDCRELFDLLPQGTIHLSALMCPEHRSRVIKSIKEKLSQGVPLRVVSTQLVEAGVDIDFPVVFRAMAGFDSIAQAAGRCNREGKLDKPGTTYIFRPERDAPPGLLRKGQYAGEEVLQDFPDAATALSPDVFKSYFRIFYGKLNSFDEKSIMTLLGGTRARDFNLQFRTAAGMFRLIDSAEQRSVVVDYEKSIELVRQLETFGPNRRLMRKLQRYSVSIPLPVAQVLAGQGSIRMLKGMDGLFVQNVNKLYSEVYGLNTDGPDLTVQDFMA